MERVKEFLHDHLMPWGETNDPSKPTIFVPIYDPRSGNQVFTLKITPGNSQYAPMDDHYMRTYNVETTFPTGEKENRVMFYRHLTNYIESLATGW